MVTIIIVNNKQREILTCLIPFNVTSAELHRYVVEGDFRPQIPREANEELQQLIRSCWQREEEKRPDLDLVSSNLQSISSLQADY